MARSARARRAVALLLLVGAVLASTVAPARAAPAPPITTYPIGDRYPHPLIAGPGGIWFASQGLDLFTDWVGRITSAGQITHFRLPAAEFVGTVNSLAAGPDGNVWYVRGNGVADAAVGYVTPAGVIRQFDLPVVEGFQMAPRGITRGPEGAMWFTRSSENSAELVRITTAGAMREFPLPGPLGGGLQGIATGPDGNLWFCQEGGNRIGRMTPTGTITEFPTPGGYTDPRGIATGADGDIWFAENNGKAVGRLRLPHAVHTAGVFRGGTWYLRNSLSAGPAQVQFSFGAAGDPPLRFRLR